MKIQMYHPKMVRFQTERDEARALLRQAVKDWKAGWPAEDVLRVLEIGIKALGDVGLSGF
jgi:hypothetical protein